MTATIFAAPVARRGVGAVVPPPVLVFCIDNILTIVGAPDHIRHYANGIAVKGRQRGLCIAPRPVGRLLISFLAEAPLDKGLGATNYPVDFRKNRVLAQR